MKMYDFIIVGGGPAGSLSAYLLGKKYSVLLIEASTQYPRKVCGEYLCPMGVELLKKIGLQKIVNNYNKIDGMLIVNSSFEEIPMRFPKYFGIALNRSTFDKELFLNASSRCDSLRGERVVKIVKTQQGFNINTKSNAYRSRYLIGADGKRSFVAKEMKIEKSSAGPRIALHCILNCQKHLSRKGEMHLFPNGSYIGVNPIGEQEYNLSLIIDPIELKNIGPARETFNHYIKKSNNLKKRFFLTKETHITSVSPLSHLVSKSYGENFILLGDAGGFLDPLTGEGIYNALWMANHFSSHYLEENNFSKATQKFIKVKDNHLGKKNTLNKFFQYIIRRPHLTRVIARFLMKKQKRADIFIGIIGNIYTPFKGLKKLILE